MAEVKSLKFALTTVSTIIFLFRLEENSLWKAPWVAETYRCQRVEWATFDTKVPDSPSSFMRSRFPFRNVRPCDSTALTSALRLMRDACANPSALLTRWAATSCSAARRG
eukprot:scaffold315253_cov31-Tisochrysis_lutea.AAC.1